MQDIAFLQEKFNKHLEKSVFNGKPSGLYEPFNYILSLGGKRMRPVMLLMAHQLYRDEVDDVMDAALAIEVFHNFTLAHDDIMDKAELRRGKPAMHTRYGINTAILCGDLMMIYTYELLSRSTGKQQWSDVFKVFNRAAIQICEGQQMDMEFETRQQVDLDEYLLMIKFKTGVLLGAAMQIGALTADAPEHEAEALYQFAVDLGLAFQIKDDWLDAYGNPEKFGKKSGGDIARNKKTYLWIKCLELASDDDKIKLIEMLNWASVREEEKIEKVIKIYDHYGIGQLTMNAADKFSKSAVQKLDTINLPAVKKEGILSFAKDVMGREY